MAKVIASAGKGGTGKTTITTLVIKYLKEKYGRPILAVDADANANLPDALGLKAGDTLADIVDDIKDRQLDGMPGGMSKTQFIEYRLQDTLIESKGIDMLVMGRPEGPGCYCAANNMLKDHIRRLSKNYDFMVMDNEAGMEHVSRRTMGQVDFLLLVSDHSRVGIKSAYRIYDVARKLKIRIAKAGLLINRVPNGLSKDLEDLLKESPIPVLGTVPFDEGIVAIEHQDRPIVDLSDDAPAYKALKEILERSL
jgi:CO dehydrogenase maturation factor